MDNKDTVKTPWQYTPNAWTLFPLVVFSFILVGIYSWRHDFWINTITVAFFNSISCCNCPIKRKTQ